MNEIKFLTELIKEKLDNDFDQVLAITGYEGFGKSTLGIQIGKGVDKNFDLEKNVAYLPTSEQLQKKFNDLPSKSAFLVDEAIKVLYKMKSIDRVQVQLNEMFATERWQNKCTILLMPRFYDFNEFFRNHRITLWAHIVKRGIAFLFEKDTTNMFNPDPWFIKDNFKTLLKFQDRTKNNIELDQLISFFETKIKNFVCAFTFNDLDQETKMKYQTLKAKYRPEAAKMYMDRVTHALLVLYREGYSLQKIAQILGYENDSTVADMINYLTKTGVIKPEERRFLKVPETKEDNEISEPVKKRVAIPIPISQDKFN